MGFVSGVDWSGDAGDPRKARNESSRLVTVVAHVDDAHWPVLDARIGIARNRRNLSERFVFHFSGSRPSIRSAFFEELQHVPFTAHARIVDKRLWPEVYLRQTTGDDRILSEIVRLIVACPDEITAKQILLIDLPKAEMKKVTTIKTALNRALLADGRDGLRLVKPCPDHDRSRGAIIQVADMIAGALHDSGDLESPLLRNLSNRIHLF